MGDSRQWPKVYDLCHTFLHVARVRKLTDMLELHASQKTHGHARISRVSCNSHFVQFSYVCVFSDSHNMQKRATKSDTSGHCLLQCLGDRMIAVPKSLHWAASVPRLTTPWATTESLWELYQPRSPGLQFWWHKWHAFYHSAIRADSTVVKGIS